MKKKIKNKKTHIIIIILLVIIIILISIDIYHYKDIKKIKEETNNIKETSNNDETNLEDKESSEEDYDPILDETLYKYQYNSAILYKNVDYNKPNVEVLNNEVILSLTWNAIVLQKASLLMNEITDYGYINKAEVENMSYDEGAVNVSIPKEKMNEYVKEVFGSEIKYVDDDIPLNMEYIRPFGPTLFESLTTDSIVSYSNETYQSRYLMGGGTGYPYILEDVKEIQKYEDYVEIYVKTSFVDIEPHDNAPSTNRIYKEFDSKTNEFVNALGVYKTDEDYEKIKNKLHTFLYTYKIDKETGEYYLASFTLNE